MPIKLKVARTAKELDDIFRLRYDVYVSERNKFSEKRATCDGRIVDHFDALPGVANVVAYDGDTAIASFRVNKDSPFGLAPEKYFDFTEVRAGLAVCSEGLASVPCVVSCSMLAIRKRWRRKRNVILALFKTVTAVMHGLGATHVFGASSAETFSIYRRLGCEAIAPEQWVESVGDKLIPLMGPFDKIFTWAFGQNELKAKYFWLDNYCAQFETILLSPGEVLFRENDRAERVYSIERGGVTLSRKGPDQKDLVIAELGQGALFGELAIFDDEQRSTTATAAMNTQMITIERSHLLDIIHNEPWKADQLLEHFAHRLRKTDHLALVQQFAPQTSRVSYALEQLWNSAKIEVGRSPTRILQMDAEPIARQIARRAQVRESEVRRVLEMRRVSGGLDYSDSVVRFFRSPSSEGVMSVDASH
ncbi:MAG: cyclic nucleotide-binding domain-containing protein [Candidatus Reddybacter sp.]